jgi:hypothetical protein
MLCGGCGGAYRSFEVHRYGASFEPSGAECLQKERHELAPVDRSVDWSGAKANLCRRCVVMDGLWVKRSGRFLFCTAYYI